jgi:hypothetical protein
MDSNSIATLVTASATAIYGVGTVALVYQLWRDRVQRDRHFQAENNARRLNDLRSAFYEAWGFWEGGRRVAGSAEIDAAQVGKEFEALIRLECQLRLNNYGAEANNLGFVIRADFGGIRDELSTVGVALGLLPTEYRQARALGFTAGSNQGTREAT